LRRWHRIDPDTKHLVEFNRKPIKPVKTGFARCRINQTGRCITSHTAATWPMQNAASPWQSASYLGASLKIQLGAKTGKKGFDAHA
jgi:hypothetical protein